ncbi:hypothetical protein YC2023_109066 [Brassica napus]
MVSTEPSLHMEVEGEDEFREEYACPFCSDYFDSVSLCCHIDEDHPMDTINGITSWGLRRWSSYSLEDGDRPWRAYYRRKKGSAGGVLDDNQLED